MNVTIMRKQGNIYEIDKAVLWNFKGGFYLKILLAPFIAIGKLVEGIIKITGRLIAVLLGLIILIIGVALTVTIIGAIIGIPLAILGFTLIIRGLF